MMDFCGFFQGKSSDFTWIPEIPYTMHPLKKSPNLISERNLGLVRVPLYMGKMGSICHFPRELPASIWGHCSQVLVFTSIWGKHKHRGVTMTLFVLFSPASGYLGTPNTAKQGKAENDTSTLFYPPPHRVPLQNRVMNFFPGISPVLLCRCIGILGRSFRWRFFVVLN